VIIIRLGRERVVGNHNRLKSNNKKEEKGDQSKKKGKSCEVKKWISHGSPVPTTTTEEEDDDGND